MKSFSSEESLFVIIFEMIKNGRRLALMASLLILVLAIGFTIPILMSDGLENHMGDGKSEAIDIVLRQELGENGKNIYPKIRVERVAYSPTGSCTDPKSLNSYSVSIRAVGLFGITLREKEYKPPLLGEC